MENKEINEINFSVRRYLEKNPNASVIFCTINPTAAIEDMNRHEIFTLIKGDEIRILLDKLSFCWAENNSCDD